MGWQNPAMPWSELETRLSGRPRSARTVDAAPDQGPGSRKRRAYQPAADVRRPEGPVVPYAELHCHSNFSFLDGASGPDRLVEEAVRLGLHGLALTDHDGFAGAPLFAETAQKYAGLVTVHGAELSLGLSGPQGGVPDPGGSHLLVLARDVEGYHRLASAITEANLRGDPDDGGAVKGRPIHDLAELAEQGRGHWLLLTGCRKGMVRSALATGGPRAAAAALDRMVNLFGSEHVVVELTDHGLPGDHERNDLLAALAQDRGLRMVATNNVHYATAAEHRLAAAMAAIRARRSMAEMDGWLPPWGAACLRSGEEMARRFARHPGAVARSVEIADEVGFDLAKARPRLPQHQIPEGETAISHLRSLVAAGFERVYRGKRHGARDLEAEARERIAHELEMIERKEFAGYFVIVHDIVAFARRQGILCQGRGSAASSAVCHVLGITAIDPVFYNLPFQRFISEHRDEEPDIDVDFDSDRREEVIQWVYETYGRRCAAQVANVITYRPKMAVRDAAKALGHSPGQQDAWSKQIHSWSRIATEGEEHDIPAPVVDLATQLLGAPRHLGIHSGGMVLTEQPISEVCPIERARMEKRTVLQWDKDAAAWMGLVKFDLLGLGMLGALDAMIRIVGERLDEHWTLETIPREEPAVYDMLCRADSIGVFQVESRAQIGTLPRLKPREFYDLAIEIALIRPGPIQGGSVHPYIRRATGKEPVSYVHDDLVPTLERTKGIPLFQEQLMEMAVVIGDCSRDDADLLRRAMGSKRGIERIDSIKEQLFAGMAKRGLVGEVADALYKQILSFANFGFAESHALSFALLVHHSSWFKLHYPAAFLAGLLRAQPMGFYSPQSLVGDARRHGVRVLRPDIARSAAVADLELIDGSAPSPTGLAGCLAGDHERTEFVPGTPDPTPAHRRDTAYAVRLGLDSVRGVSREVAERIVTARRERPFADLVDLARRAALDERHLEALATAGALAGFGHTRREALWHAGRTESEEHLPGATPGLVTPPLPGMSAIEETLADLWATRITPDSNPFDHLRELLRDHGVKAVAELAGVEPRRRVHVAGMVTHRQRPSTAGGVTFLNLEDETGMLNVVCSVGLWHRYRRVARNSAAMVIRGILERNEGVTNLVADRLAPLESVHPAAGQALRARHASRDFQ
ncbi:error-prone DNA polymerase [Nocardioides sp. AE5]|uniref:error-prone DNA polymerase n=1 Tax=Nocardioides sp. AE5 TaxID=2962573 RepID=UPI002882268E|nr:error-prone DNA polymerase [Nocardioides sp. AE5]MDT0200919.1 error-prone DNA polymerase [Nocardioides sp. AE5]